MVSLLSVLNLLTCQPLKIISSHSSPLSGQGHRHSEITQRDKNQDFGKTYLIKKASNLQKNSNH